MKALAQNTLIQNRYLVVHLIGKGGMGEVYLAVDQRLGSAVALKRTFFAGDEMLGNAFEREAKTLARMRHPVLPKVSDHFGEDDDQYLVMEHISGDDLAKRLEVAQKPFPVSWVLFWADQLLDALSYLHTHEPPIIHRDIKPQNLKLTDENHIILLDFGLSKTSTGQTNLSDKGSTGSVVGYTPHYASMEQIRGIGTSAKSDLYSLSATLYQLVTNTVPADALSRADALLNGMPDPIRPPSELNPEIPPSISEIILKGMEVSQEKRFQNAREMQKALRKAFTDMQQATTAETVAFNIHSDKVAAIDQPAATLIQNEIPQSPNSRSSYSSEPASSSFPSGNFDSSGSAAPNEPDFDATIAIDSLSRGGEVKQSDIKTQVFIGGELAEATESSSVELKDDADLRDLNTPAPVEIEPIAVVPEAAADPAAAATDYFSNDFSDVGHNGSVASDVPLFEPPNEKAEVEPVPQAVAPRTVASPAKTAAAGKKSSGKAIVLIGALAALIILGASIVGGAYFYYVNNIGSAIVTPSPSPEPSPEPSISPESTPELPSVNENTNVNIGIETNSNTNRLPVVEPSPDATPADERPERDTGPSKTNQGPARTTSKPTSTPKGKQTPKSTAKPSDRTRILQ